MFLKASVLSFRKMKKPHTVLWNHITDSSMYLSFSDQSEVFCVSIKQIEDLEKSTKKSNRNITIKMQCRDFYSDFLKTVLFIGKQMA